MTLRENIKIHIDKLSDTSKKYNKNKIAALYEKADFIDKIEDENRMAEEAKKLMEQVDTLIKLDSNMKDLGLRK